MIRNTGKKIATLSVLALIAAAASAPLTASGWDGRHQAKLEGTWRVTVTTFNCTTQAAAPPFTSILSFSEGGSMTETTANPAFQPGQRSIGLGNWRRTGWNTYWVTTSAFILFDSPTPPPPPPFVLQFLRGGQRIDQGITMTGRDSWTSEANLSLTRPDGSEYFFGCARASATRIE